MLSLNIKYTFAKLFVAILRSIPKKQFFALCDFFGPIIKRQRSEDADIAKLQLKLVFPEKSDDEIDNIISANFSHLFKTIYEVFTIKLLAKLNSEFAEATSFAEQPFKYINFKGDAAAFNKCLNSNIPCILLSGHIGCFELLAACVAKFKQNHTQRHVFAIGKNPNYEVLDHLLKDVRSDYGVETIWRDDPKAITKLLKSIKEKNWLAVLIDQDTGVENYWADFFGISAAYPVTLVRYAIKHSVPILSAFIVRENDLTHSIYLAEIKYSEKCDEHGENCKLNIDNGEKPNASAETAMIENALQIYSAQLEELVRKYPDQWPWWHRRWRRQAEDKGKKNTKMYFEWLNKMLEKQRGN